MRFLPSPHAPSAPKPGTQAMGRDVAMSGPYGIGGAMEGRK
ncbi:hypothetical protein [Paraburkholderia haematera]|uniref:Uncharacterized protein n=1 Tax=Paraburkholderia haematera TaxID=2793077 RepID=A0ABN7KZI3_9BURK|nr:hypothetical protein [Paraburkholderia haematera]CAE6722534.1 hypothetical protein R69888_01677 [Paraburkholderia haematera]